MRSSFLPCAELLLAPWRVCRPVWLWLRCAALFCVQVSARAECAIESILCKLLNDMYQTIRGDMTYLSRGSWWARPG